MKTSKVASIFLALCIFLQPLAAYSVEYIKEGETKTFQKDGYVFSAGEAKKAAENQRKVKKLEQQVEEYQRLVKNMEQESKFKDDQIRLAQEEALQYRRMYADAYMAYEKEKDRNSVWYNNKAIWALGGALMTIGAAAAGYAAVK